MNFSSEAQGRAGEFSSSEGDYCLEAAVGNIGQSDWQHFNRLTSVELSNDEKIAASRPNLTAPVAREYLAVHWHPEWVPLEFIEERLKTAFPQADNFLAVPTQHNKVMAIGPWAGVEVDVYDRRYGQKVQLLIHLPVDRLPQATAFQAMIEHTYNYRAHQLMDILNRLASPEGLSKIKDSLKCSITDPAVKMARFYATRLRAMIEKSGIIGGNRDEMLKNRLLPDFMTACLPPTQRNFLGQAIIVINVVKKIVKSELRPEKFYAPQEIIEEARSLGAGIVIPHPPQFWPILISGLDVDGWEVWNPSTPHHTLFLLEAMARANEGRKQGKRLLAFMGDDTHMSAKIRFDQTDEKDSANREIGFQPPWADLAVGSALKDDGQSMTRTINEYRSRLGQ